MGVYTKTGDAGATSLYTGERVSKNSPRVETYGTIDEVDSFLGMARAFCENEVVVGRIYNLQKMLYLLMADLASLDRAPNIREEHVALLEREIDEMEAVLPPIKEFVVPGDTKGGAMLDVARTVARRAERRFCTFSEKEVVQDVTRAFLNRISDYCYMLMRMEELKK